MDWVEANFLVDPPEPWRGLLMVELMDLGYEGFEDTAHGLKAYIPKTAADLGALRKLRVAKDPHCRITHTVREVPDENWNARWESSFQPIDVDGRVHIRAGFHPEVQGFEYQLVITPKMAFGTGHHATTRMMVRAILDLDLTGKRVLDLGCGTGVLAILAEQRGAAEVLAIDNDPVAVENALETMALNGCERTVVEEGGTDLTDRGVFDAILANIERNTLNRAMPDLYRALSPGSVLLLSGFVAQDLGYMQDAARAHGLHPAGEDMEGEWVMLKCTKNGTRP
jgi:ribosomal protein L11 methyltransferase